MLQNKAIQQFIPFIIPIQTKKTMRNEKQTVLQMLVHPRAGENFDRKQTQKELLEAITHKNEQISILHQVNTRLGYELSLLQRKLGIDPEAILRQLQKIGEISPIFSSDLGHLQYLQHLLIAYDETILKQKKIIAMLYSQLEDFQKRSDTLVRQNEYLLEENKNKCKKILEIYHRGSPEQNLTLAYNRLLRETQQERNDVVKEESQEVIGAYNQLLIHTHNLEKELQETKKNSQKYFQSLKRQSEELKEALLSVDNLLKVKEFLEKTVTKLGDENISLQSHKNQNESRINKLQAQIKALRSQMQTQRKISRQQAERISFQLDSLKSESQNACKRQRETFNRNMIMQKQIQVARQSLRSLKRQNQKVKGELQQTLKMCQTYESKITSQVRKQQGLLQIVNKKKEELDTIILDKDKALLKVDRLEKVIEDLSNRAREDQSRLRDTYQKMLGEQQDKLRMIQQQKQQSSSVFMQSELALKNQIEKLSRQNSLLREQNLKFIQSIHINTGSQIISKIKEYQAKNDSLLKLLSQKQRQLKDQQSKYEESIHDAQAEIKNLTRLLQKQKNASTQYMKEVTQQRSKSNILANEKECLENQLKRLKKNYQNKHLQLSDDREGRIQDLQMKLNESIKKEKQIKAKALEMLERYDESELKLKNHYEKIVAELDAQNEKLRRKINKKKIQQ